MGADRLQRVADAAGMAIIDNQSGAAVADQPVGQRLHDVDCRPGFLDHGAFRGGLGQVRFAGGIAGDGEAKGAVVARHQAFEPAIGAAQELADRIYHTTEVFYANPFGDMHNRMKEALILLGRLDGQAVVRPPLMKLTETEIARIAEAMTAAGIARDGAAGLQTPALAAE